MMTDTGQSRSPAPDAPQVDLDHPDLDRAPLERLDIDAYLPRSARVLWEKARYKAFWGGRSGTKSHSIATALLLLGRDRPLRIVCCREIQNSIAIASRSSLKTRSKPLHLDNFYTWTDSEIRAANGTTFIFKGLWHNPDTVKSLEGADIVWVEEAQSISQVSLDILRPTVRKPGSQIWFSWNPKNKTDPVDAMFRGEAGPPPNSIIVHLNYYNNPFLSDETRAEIEWDKRRDPERYAHIWLGHYQIRSEARVFKNWRIGTHEEFEAFTWPGENRVSDRPHIERFYYGADWGFSVAPSVLVRCFIVGRTLYIDREAYAVGCEIDYTPFLFGGCDDKELIDYNREAFEGLSPDRRQWEGIEQARKWPIIADSARPEIISHMHRHGFPNVRSAVKGAGSLEEGVTFLQSYDIVVHPSCVHTIDELTMYSWKTDPKTEEVLPVLADKHNHVIDAVRYAIEGRRGYDTSHSYVG